MVRYDLDVVPVVDDDNCLVGAITADDLVDVLEEEATEDVQRLGGAEPLGRPYRSTSIAQTVRSRVGLLVLLLATFAVSSVIMDLFRERLEAAIILTFFVPMLMGTGGNTGSQTIATLIRALAVGDVHPGRRPRLWRELRAGSSRGLLAAAATRLSLWGFPGGLAVGSVRWPSSSGRTRWGPPAPSPRRAAADRPGLRPFSPRSSTPGMQSFRHRRAHPGGSSGDGSGPPHRHPGQRQDDVLPRRFFRAHLRLNLDMLRTAGGSGSSRPARGGAAVRGGQPNPTRADRARPTRPGAAALSSATCSTCRRRAVARNARRVGKDACRSRPSGPPRPGWSPSRRGFDASTAPCPLRTAGR